MNTCAMYALGDWAGSGTRGLYEMCVGGSLNDTVGTETEFEKAILSGILLICLS